MTNRKIEYWVIPPAANGEFVAHMQGKRKKKRQSMHSGRIIEVSFTQVLMGKGFVPSNAVENRRQAVKASLSAVKVKFQFIFRDLETPLMFIKQHSKRP